MNFVERLFPVAFLIAAFGFCVGCNGNVHVSGKVTYPDGTPLSIGQIVFTDNFYMARSDINKNGEYSLHSYRRNDGIPRGIYKVYITGAFRFEKDEDQKESDLAAFRFDRMIGLIDMQHTNPDTSGWEFELKKNQKINFIVYPPNEVPDEERTESARLFFEEGYREKVQKEQGKSFELKKKHRRVNPNLL